jgi:hypothetical protein
MDMILFQSILPCAIASPLPPEPRRDGGTSPFAYFPLRQGQRARQAPDAGSLGRTSVAVMVCPSQFLPCRPRTAEVASLRDGIPTNPHPLDSCPYRGLTTSAVSTRPKNSKISRRSLPVVSLGRFPTQISILCPFPSYETLVCGGRAKQRQRTREMGLEAGKISVTHDRASRLHQAIILSSEQHATAEHCTPLGRRCKFISILCPKYF